MGAEVIKVENPGGDRQRHSGKYSKNNDMGSVDMALNLPVRRALGRSPGIELTVRAENIFDASYQQTVGFPGRGRTMLGGVRVEF